MTNRTSKMMMDMMMRMCAMCMLSHAHNDTVSAEVSSH